MTHLIKRHLCEGVLTLTLERPDKLNALTHGMYEHLTDLLRAAQNDDETQVVIITGGERCFTAGNDLKDFLQVPPSALDAPAFRFMGAVLDLDKPLIAAVAGAAVGIGTTLLLHCDQVLVTRDAKLRMPFVNLGLCPEFGASLLLPQLVGHARAARLLLWGDGLSGEQAVAWGLANEAFDEGAQCLAAARQLAERITRLPQASVRLSKQLLKAPQRAALEEAIAREGALFIERLRSDEARSALDSLMAPR
ncbi:MAG: enoyl-CoA hydratase-related protein [Pseudomonas sp.]|nr:enoyl-CoA hydratase-related protein [Pseudomonas sp.]